MFNSYHLITVVTNQGQYFSAVIKTKPAKFLYDNIEAEMSLIYAEKISRSLYNKYSEFLKTKE